MDNLALLQKEEEITTGYRAFLDEVREAFNRHCDEIKAQASQKLAMVPETDQEGRKQILDAQKDELDRTLAELKQLLNQKALIVRRELEEIANLRDRQEFDVDQALKAL